MRNYSLNNHKSQAFFKKGKTLIYYFFFFVDVGLKDLDSLSDDGFYSWYVTNNRWFLLVTEKLLIILTLTYMYIVSTKILVMLAPIYKPLFPASFIIWYTNFSWLSPPFTWLDNENQIYYVLQCIHSKTYLLWLLCFTYLYYTMLVFSPIWLFSSLCHYIILHPVYRYSDTKHLSKYMLNYTGFTVYFLRFLSLINHWMKWYCSHN